MNPDDQNYSAGKMPMELLFVIGINMFLIVVSVQYALMLGFPNHINGLLNAVFLIVAIAGIPLMIAMIYALFTKRLWASEAIRIRNMHLVVFFISAVIWMVRNSFPTEMDVQSLTIFVIALVSSTFLFGAVVYGHFYLLSRKSVRDYFRSPGAL